MSSSFPMRNMRVRFSGETNIGMKRKHNEDSFLIPDYERVAVVADGMGATPAARLPRVWRCSASVSISNRRSSNRS